MAGEVVAGCGVLVGAGDADRVTSSGGMTQVGVGIGVCCPSGPNVWLGLGVGEGLASGDVVGGEVVGDG
ncbi:hypothetical protein [Mobilicoccus caccae]|uniref:Uncharacterized protein n=1 Tax=Mobilicoccus caccae TaxID=1859295 RepID=A0ABQ6ITG3_9MICO|nr:hypothetical protein [Mobilicoccus caccae]GMA41200.1 hypothetical protein GCM10025883_32450 [Mobilicoccus caccae]